VFPERDDVARVGIWVVVTGALVGLAFLFVQRAHADEIAGSDAAIRVLTERAPLTADERVEHAEAWLEADETEKRWRLHNRVLQAGWSTWLNPSPRSVLRNVRGLLREVRDWGDRSGAEDHALDLLEVDASGGLGRADQRALYDSLLLREERDERSYRLDRAREAVQAGHFMLARVRLDRAFERWPDLAGGSELRQELALATTASHATTDPTASEPETPQAESRPDPAVAAAWEVHMSAALLLADYDRAASLGPEQPAAELGRATALLLSGQRDTAFARLEELGEDAGRVGQRADQLTRDAALWPELSFEREWRSFQVRRALGWIGGSELSARGLSLSHKGYSAWEGSASPLNLALSLPARVLGGWHPDATDLSSAAATYLDEQPDGAHRELALDWSLEYGREIAARQRGWDDARFVLPHPNTVYEPLTAAPVFVSRDAIDAAPARVRDVLAPHLGDAPGVLLAVRCDSGEVLDGEVARRVLNDLAAGLERNEFQTMGADRAQVLGAVRRIDTALADGQELRVQGWSGGSVAWSASLQSALLDGGGVGDADARFYRGDENLSAQHSIGEMSTCPARAYCIDRESLFDASLQGFVDLDARGGIGADASLAHAYVSLRLDPSGPRAQVVLPIARWLGVERWVPLEAYLDVSLTSLSGGPRLSP